MAEDDRCPDCGSSWQGAAIPEAQRELYGNKTHFERQIGIEVRGIYDGVIAWQCPDCGIKRHRFSGQTIGRGDTITREGVTAGGLMARIEADLEAVSDWRKVEDPELTKNGGSAYSGQGAQWRFLVVGVPGTMIRGGGVTRRPDVRPVELSDPVLVNMPAELAAKGYAAAGGAQ